MTRINYILAFVVAVSISISAVAQSLSLDSCVAMAVRNNADVKNADLAVEEAKQTKSAALTKYFPAVSASAGAFHSDRPFIEYGISNIGNSGIRDVLQTIYYNILAPFGISDHLSFLQKGVVSGVVAMQPVYAGGRIVTGNKLAKLGIEASEYQKEIKIREIELRTEELYWQCKMLEEKRRTVEVALQLLHSLEKDVRVAIGAGLITPNDGLKVKLKINEMNANTIKIENGIRLCKMALCQQIGVAYNDSVTLSDTLKSVSEPWALKADNSAAVQGRSEFKLLDLNVKAKKLEKRMILGETLPQIGIGGSYSYNNLMDRNAFNLTGFAMVQVPITAWWEASHNIKKQNYRIQEAENLKADVTGKLELQTQKIWDELDAAYRSYELAEEAVSDAKENLRLSLQYYKAGLITLSELLEAQTLYRQALDSRVEQTITYLICLRHYKQLAGV